MSRDYTKSGSPVYTEIRIDDDPISILSENIPAILFVVDKNGIIVRASSVASSVFPAGTDSLIGSRFSSLATEAENKRVIDDLFSSDQAVGNTFPLEIPALKKSGDREIFSMNASTVMVRGELSYLIVMTPRNVPAEYSKIEMLEHQAAIGTFTSGIAHEFNNILAGIRGYAQLAKNDLNDLSLVKKAFNVIENETSRGAQLCKNLSLYAGNKRLNLEPVDLSMVIRQIIDAQAKFLSEHGISVITDIAEIPPIIADTQRIFQLLTNLVTNARHAIISKGRGRITISLVADDDFVRIRVSDDGIGIPQHQIDHIFEPFFINRSLSRPSGARTDEIRGTGLGLPVCKAIAKQHGGSVTVESGDDSGTVFTVSLPKKIAQVFPGNSSDTWKKGDQRRPVKVLVVDDEMSIREVVYRTLCNLETETFLAGNITEMQDIIMEYSFDLIFLDYVLPEMNADKILPVIRDKFPSARIVIISGWNGSPRKKAQIERSVDAWIEKPFNVELITEQLEICRKKRFF